MSTRQSLRHARLVLMLGAVCLNHGAVRAQDDAARAQLEQKIRLTEKLIADSPAAQRIGASGNTQALAHLDEGRLHHAIARDLLARGDLAGARRAVDEALRHLGHARRLVPDASARQAALRERHEALLASTQRLVDAWQRRVGSDADATDLTGALGLVANARQLAGEGRVDEANGLLAKAERHVLDGMMRTLRTRTIDYSTSFTTPAEEFQHELARQQSFADLVPLALRELRPGAEAVALVERYARSGEALRLQALQRFNAGELPLALAHIRESTQVLQRALLAAGLVAPPATGTPP